MVAIASKWINSQGRKELALERKAYRISEVIQMTGLGRSTIYKMLSDGKMRRIKAGAATLIPAKDVDALVG